MTESAMRAKLSAIGQASVLRFWSELSPSSRTNLLESLSALDLAGLDRIVQTQVKVKAELPIPKNISPVTPYPHAGSPAAARHADQYAKALARGNELLAAGKVGAFLVAGGQGTRLGYDGPKGEYPVTPLSNKPLFQVFAEQLRAHAARSGKPIPWYIMTSDANDSATRAFFERHHHFGYKPKDIFFFQQGMMPAFAFSGEMLLAEKDTLCLSPDGHGGSLRALKKSGALSDMRARGIEHLSYFQVDNPLVHCIDPLFIGLHDLTGSEMSSKTIAKAAPLEKVGNFCLAEGKLQVIEYSDLPESLALQTNADGSLKFNAGSIAIHALRVSFIERLNSGGELHLPWHRAEKKVPCLDATGHLIKPEKPNAIKLEQFVFDAIPLAQNAIVYTTDRAEEFSPVKNAEGNDSPATCRRDQVRRHARWLKENGVIIPTTPEGEPDCALEISPLFAAHSSHLKGKQLPHEIQSGETKMFE